MERRRDIRDNGTKTGLKNLLPADLTFRRFAHVLDEGPVQGLGVNYSYLSGSRQLGDFVFYRQFLFFEGRNLKIIWMRSVVFGLDG